MRRLRLLGHYLSVLIEIPLVMAAGVFLGSLAIATLCLVAYILSMFLTHSFY